MLVHDQHHAPAQGNGRFFVDRGNWTQLNPLLSGGNKNYPFAERDRNTPYQQFKMVGLYCGPRSLEVTFDLDLADLASLDSVQGFLSSGGCQRAVKLEFFKNGWVQESFDAPTPALARINQILRYRGLHMLRKTIVRDRPIGKLSGELKQALVAWCADKSRDAFTRSDFFEKSVVLKQDTCGLRFESVGQASTARRFFGEQWSCETIGRFLTQSADNPDYDKNVACAYRLAIEINQPHHDQVMASVVRDGTREWTAYDRLILPFEGSLATLVRLQPPSETSLGFLAN